MVLNNYLNILISGIGGQGIITLSRVIAEAAVSDNINAIVSETHGLSQRGGSVEVHLRIGDVYAPLIPKGEADILLSMEIIEAARNISYLRDHGVAITSDTILRPAIPGVKIPKKEDIINEFSRNKISLYIIPARELSEKAGSYLTENMVLLGALYKIGKLYRFISEDSIRKTISSLRNPELNLKAYKLGADFCFNNC
ncbi:MAG: indolepyruvate oxidoreductase subunit beta [Caldisphaera sp.]|jgi:indolepyruvate ferredoxin oxidoreductase beta subunit|nr:indolepyruvate oxidoreductase subunit beta [Caldisphaera sp.]